MSIAKNQQLIKEYLLFIQTNRRLAGQTQRSYAYDFSELLNFVLALEHDISLAHINSTQIRKFAIQMHSRGLGSASIARKLSAWRGFFDWLAQSGEVLVNPVNGIKAPRRAKGLPKALSPDAACQLMTGQHPDAKLNQPINVCNQAMFELLYSSGLRISELIGLDVCYVHTADYSSAGWIDFAEADVVVTGKGGKIRNVPVSQPAMQAIQRWIAVRNLLAKDNCSALFLTSRGTRISARLIQLRIKAHAQLLGLPVNMHPHMLRHSFASHLLQSSGDLRAVQELLGHSSITSTQVYTSLDFQRLAQVYDSAHPRARKKPLKSTL